MRQTLALTLAAALALAAPLAAQTTPRGMYERLTSRELTARKALAAGKGDAARRDITRVIVGYEGLVARFPRSAYSDNALWQAAMLAAESYARFRVETDRQSSVRLLKRLQTEYPTSSLARQTKAALARLDLPPGTSATASRAGANQGSSSAPLPSVAPPTLLADSDPTPSAARAPSSSVALAHAVPPKTSAHGLAQLRAIRRTVLPEVVRIAIELDREVEYHDERIENPDRIFIDLQGTEPTTSIQPVSFDEDLVRGVRLGSRPGGSTRVVLDLHEAGRHSVFTLYNPYRIVVDLDRSAAPKSPAVLSAVATTSNPGQRIVRAVDVPAPAATPTPKPAAPPALVAERVSVPSDEDVKPAPQVDSVAAGATLNPGIRTSTLSPPAKDTDAPEPLPAKEAAPKAAMAKGPAPVAPAPPATNLEGRFSLSRQLGLGISRIVIDPGHGGHDPGAQGRGLNEADLVLDVALRLEQLLAREPGVEVVLTRRTDVFVPLEERTAIANRESADLFLSIHANASRNPKARGVETYFLNFSSTPDAEAVAARENSASGRAMHSLPDIVKAITLNNKLDESRDFATLVQRSMVDHLSGANKDLRDLGVKQAPFVVLIGAGMPSVLAEISFITHTQEGKLLKGKAYRQKIAESLYQGIERYQRALKAVKTVANQ
jgi:N-acetylmuramoyl-L-alanine amidase